VDVWKHTSLGNRNVPQELVQLLVIANGELQVTGDDAGLLVISCCVASKLENFGRQVLQDGGEVDRSSGADTLGVVSLAEKTMNTADWESETGFG